MLEKNRKKYERLKEEDYKHDGPVQFASIEEMKLNPKMLKKVEEKMALLQPTRNCKSVKRQINAFKQLQKNYTSVTKEVAKKINTSKESSKMLNSIQRSSLTC